MRISCLLVWAFSALLLQTALATITPDQKRKEKQKKPKPKSSDGGGTKASTVREVIPKEKDLLEFTPDLITKHFPRNVLGYVTPWNNHGYRVASMFPKKFTWISPVWFQVKPGPSFSDTGEVSFDGLHDVDQNWTRKLQDAGVKVVPRLLFEGWSGNQLYTLLENSRIQEKVLATIFHQYLKLKMDGLVLEIWRQTPAQLHPLLVSFLSRFGQTARQNNFEFILVIPPPSVHEDNEDSMLGYFTPQNFQSLLSDVTAFSFMTYDFSSVAKPGPNSPLPWVQGCIKLLLSGIPEGDQVMMHEASSKILVGLNFYGMDYTATGGRPILGRELQNHISDAENQLEDVQVHFSDEAVEHFFSFREKGQQHLVFFPTVHSIQARLQLATSFGVGIAIWELGQGMNFFYEVL